MKKYLLTALLGVFGLFSFASADTVDGFTSDSDIYKVSFSSDDGGQSSELENYYNSSVLDYGTPIYYCFLTIPSDFYVSVSGNDPVGYVSSLSPCLSSPIVNDDDYLQTWGDINGDNMVSVNGYVYSSVSPITYSSSGGGSSSSSSSTILSGGISQLSPVISSISSVMSEFIPYVVYIGIGILLVTLGFKAIKRLVNWLSSKITRYFK